MMILSDQHARLGQLSLKLGHRTSKEMPTLDSVNHCTSKNESRFGISKFGIPIEIRSLMYAGIGCTMSNQNSPDSDENEHFEVCHANCGK